MDLVIRSKEEFDDGGIPLFWHNDDGWVMLADAQKFTPEESSSLNLPLTGVWQTDHRGHFVTYNEDCIASFQIATVTDRGDVRLEAETCPDIEAISDTFIYCETCEERLDGLSIGASDGWSVV